MVEVEDFLERLCRLGADRGPRRFPRKQRDREILMKSIVMGFDSERSYTEREVNARLRRWSREIAPAIDCDHVTLRRMLVDYGHFERRADGQEYRLSFPARPVAFDLEIDDIDLPATIAAYIDQAERASKLRAEKRRRPASS